MWVTWFAIPSSRHNLNTTAELTHTILSNQYFRFYNMQQMLWDLSCGPYEMISLCILQVPKKSQYQQMFPASSPRGKSHYQQKLMGIHSNFQWLTMSLQQLNSNVFPSIPFQMQFALKSMANILPTGLDISLLTAHLILILLWKMFFRISQMFNKIKVSKFASTQWALIQIFKSYF